ncbi:MAG: lipoprotein-releasing ABC transporter permease subunit [Steroidobacteraceae bacterium]
MALPYEILLGTRYLRSTQRRGFISFIALISVAGLTLGVAVLIVVLSVMNGFESELRSRILTVTSHATLMGLEGPLPEWRAAQAMAQKQPGVTGAVPYIEAQAMFALDRKLTGALVRGIDPQEEAGVAGLGQRLQSGRLGDLQAGRYRIILGDALAQELGAKLGSQIVLIAPEGSATPTGVVPRMRRFEVTGIFHSGMYEFDRGLALVHMADAARLYRLGDQVTGIRIALEDPFTAPQAVRQIALQLGGGFYVSDWTRNHANFFRSIEMTKRMLFVILSMMVGVAAFNIVATLVMIVKEKQTDIAILRTMGAAPSSVMSAFALQGLLIAIAGILLGVVLGVLLSSNLESLVHGLERLTGERFLDAKVYFMSDLPARVEFIDVLQISGVALVLCALATLYPAWRASRTAPAEALRHD